MSAFIESHRDRFGVEPICKVMGVSASAYYHRRARSRSAWLGSPWARRRWMMMRAVKGWFMPVRRSAGAVGAVRVGVVGER